MSLLQGPVVFIDDEIGDPSKPAYQLANQIRDTGRPIAGYADLPPSEHAEHWRSIAFVVLDWDLAPGSPGMVGGSTLSEYARLALFEWLEEFLDRIFCPVFIVSAEDVADIERQVAANDKLRRVLETRRLKIFSKAAVMADFLGHLEDWVSSTPALAALNVWANEYELATDRLFHDMDKLAADWPAYVWETAEKDGIDPSFELAAVLTANLLHRIDAVAFDIPAIHEFQGARTASAMRRVSYGRTTLPGHRLYDTMVLPGDMFQDADDPGLIWLNVTPACHTVLNRPAKAGAEPDPASVSLHLVGGRRLDAPTSNSKLSRLRIEYDNANGMLVHTLLGDEPYGFQFKERRLRNWGELAEHRVGRLLPPFITLLQQRHAAFLMNEGLPRVEYSLYEDLVP